LLERNSMASAEITTASSRLSWPSWSATQGPRSMVLRAFYYIYERRLLHQVRQRPPPRHVGIILDGNRRHGRSLGLTDPRAIYRLGAQKLDEMLDWCAELAIPAVTLWVFSTDNLQRPAEEVTGIFGALETKMAALASDPQIHRRRVRVRAIGELALVPASTLSAIRSAEQATRAYDTMQLHIAVAYGGRQEIVDAVRASLRNMASEGATLPEAIERLTPDAIAGCLYTAGLPDPDLIIRTSGEIRLSGFLLWQSAHSEFYFSDVNWPAFRRVDFLRAIRAYQGRQRRHGR
jgi:short-chain Z-isoprenyl diphosphate synthase